MACHSLLVLLSLLVTCCKMGNGEKTDDNPSLVSYLLRDKFLSAECEITVVVVTFTSVVDYSSPWEELSTPEMSSTGGVFALSTISSTDKENLSFPLVTFKREQDVHRHITRSCGTAIIKMSQVTPNLLPWLSDTLMPKWMPILRKDEDHFVFLFDHEDDLNLLLLSDKFGNKIKFKIGIVSQAESHIDRVTTVDLYPAKGGLPYLKAITYTPSERSPASSLFFPDTKNFHGKYLRVASPRAPHYIEIKPDPSAVGGWRGVRGLYKIWLDVMQEKFNFTLYLFQSSAGGSPGKRLKNGTWVGSMGEILGDRADMAAFSGHIYNRHKLVHWSSPLTYECMVFITQKPKSFFSASAVYRPFPVILWIGLGISVGILGATIRLILAKFRKDTTVAVLSHKRVMVYFFTSFLEQEAQYLLQSAGMITPIRMLASFWLLFAMIISTAYKGKLVGLIAFPEFTWIPTTFDELAYSPTYRIGLNVFGKGGATYSVLSTSKSPVYQTFFQKMEIFPDSVVCLQEVLRGEMGCLMVRSVAEFYGAKNFSDFFGRSPFQASEQTALFRENGYIWEKRAIFRNHFDRTTWSIQESGLASLWFHQDLHNVKKKRLDWEKLALRKKSSTAVQVGEGPIRLKRSQFIGVIYLYISGCLLSTVLILVEKLYNRLQQSRAKQRLEVLRINFY